MVLMSMQQLTYVYLYLIADIFVIMMYRRARILYILSLPPPFTNNYPFSSLLLSRLFLPLFLPTYRKAEQHFGGLPGKDTLW